MPSLGADMDEGTVVQWFVGPGDHVDRGDVVALVDTDKADIEVEVFESGTIAELLVPVGRKVPVGTALAEIRADAGAPSPVPSPPSVAGPERPAAPEPEQVVPTPVAPAARPTSAATPAAPPPAPPLPAPRSPAVVPVAVATVVPPRPTRERVTPRARRRAEELGIALDDVPAGAGGTTTGDDVERAAMEPRPPIPAPPEGSARSAAERAAGLRAATAALMERSQREIPHYFVAHDVDCQALLTWLAARNAERPVAERVLPAAAFVRAVVRALVEVPELNGWWEDGAWRRADGIHVGVAVALRGGGLVVPAIMHAEALDLDGTMRSLADLVRRARRGRLRASEVGAPSITVSDLGDLGVTSVLPVIYPPQVAIVGLGRVAERPWALDGMLGVRPVVTATLAADHRATDGAVGARFLRAFDRLVQVPEAL
jgi:pyruvate dehydrogenase E2 component (dihydrolipoamide acetyltransferase)